MDTAFSAVALTAVFLSRQHCKTRGKRDTRRGSEGEEREAHTSHPATLISLEEWVIPWVRGSKD